MRHRALGRKHSEEVRKAMSDALINCQINCSFFGPNH